MTTTMGNAVDRPICGAKNRQGNPCGRPAGWGTDHSGKGRCKLHGGRSPIKSGRYSKVAEVRVADLVNEMEADPDPLNVLPELALARALLHDWLDRYTEARDALFRWNMEEFQDAKDAKRPPRPARIPDIQELVPLLDGISKAVARVEKARSDNAISRAEYFRIMTEMGRIVDLCVEDPAVRKRIGDGWMGMRLA